MENSVVLRKEIVAGTGTYNISYDKPYTHVYLYTNGAVSLSGDVAINLSGGSVRTGETLIFHCNLVNVDLNGFNLTILASTVSQKLMTSGEFLVFASNTPSKGTPIFLPSMNKAEVINTTQLEDSSVTTVKINNAAVTNAKLAGMSRGTVKVGGAGDLATDVNAKTSGNLLIGNGTDVTSVAVSGDVTISSTGVTTIGAGKVNPSMLSFSLTSYLEATIVLSSAEILSLFSSPITILPAPGANNVYNIISVFAYNNFNTAAYNGGTDLLELQIGSKVWSFTNAFLEATTDTINQGTRVDNADMTANTALTATTTSADPTTGDGTITLKIIYTINSI